MPDVARAIVGLYRKQVSVTLGTTKEIPYVFLKGSGLAVQILASDWAKIEPYIKDGTLDPLLFPMIPNGYNDPNVSYSLTLLSPNDPYYVHVLGVLTPLFPE